MHFSTSYTLISSYSSYPLQYLYPCELLIEDIKKIKNLLGGISWPSSFTNLSSLFFHLLLLCSLLVTTMEYLYQIATQYCYGFSLFGLFNASMQCVLIMWTTCYLVCHDFLHSLKPIHLDWVDKSTYQATYVRFLKYLMGNKSNETPF